MGTALSHYDNDGWLDLILSNGHPDDQVDDRNSGIHYRQPLLLLHNVGGTNGEHGAAAGSTSLDATQHADRGRRLNNDGFPTSS